MASVFMRRSSFSIVAKNVRAWRISGPAKTNRGRILPGARTSTLAKRAGGTRAVKRYRGLLISSARAISADGRSRRGLGGLQIDDELEFIG